MGSETQAGPQPTIVVAHGWSSNMAQVLPIADFLHQSGFGVLLYDARSHGTSTMDNPITLQKIAQDLRGAIDYLEGRADVDMTQLGVVGHSMGGSGAILATSIEPRIRVLVSSAAFADPVALTREYMRLYHIPRGPIFHLVCYFINRWLESDMAEIAPKNRIGRINIPILLLHGDADRVVSPANMKILLSQAQKGNTQAQLISGGKHHSTIIKDSKYKDLIITFLQEHLETDIPRLQHEDALVVP